MAKKTEMTYEKAMERLEQIVRSVENNELDIDHLSEKLKEAQGLIRLCKERLYKADEQVKQILDSATKM